VVEVMAVALGVATPVEIRVEMEAAGVMAEQVRSNSALVTDACAAALRAFCSAAQRGSWA
jgi:hypothetical protein